VLLEGTLKGFMDRTSESDHRLRNFAVQEPRFGANAAAITYYRVGLECNRKLLLIALVLLARFLPTAIEKIEELGSYEDYAALFKSLCLAAFHTGR
jgi:hypothetical protein